MKLGKLLKKLFNPRPTIDYVSEIDKFLQSFDATHPAYPTAEAEKAKHLRIAAKRDHAVPVSTDSLIWKEF